MNLFVEKTDIDRQCLQVSIHHTGIEDIDPRGRKDPARFEVELYNRFCLLLFGVVETHFVWKIRQVGDPTE